MPTLDWIGKKAVVNHHNEVPFHLLKEVPDCRWRSSEAVICLWKVITYWH